MILRHAFCVVYGPCTPEKTIVSSIGHALELITKKVDFDNLLKLKKVVEIDFPAGILFLSAGMIKKLLSAA